MFRLLVMRYLAKTNGEAFNVQSNHAFFVELPTQLCNTHKATTIEDVKLHFYFLAHNHNSEGITKIEVRDSLKEYRYSLELSSIIQNKLKLSQKEIFVMKYLDALDTNKLKITGKTKDDWNYKTHPNIVDNRQIQLIKKYCPSGLTSLVFLKCFLSFMCRQFVQLQAMNEIRNEFCEPITINMSELLMIAFTESCRFCVA